MAAIFPPASKGGVPPGGGVAYGYVPLHPVTGEGPLYISSSCATALTSDQMNGLTSEHLAAVDLLGFSYNSAKVTNLGDALVARLGDKVTRSGDTMTGPLFLSSHPITGNLQAVTKVYVDGNLAGVQSAITGAYQAADAVLQTQINGKVSKAGDTMTGFLTLHAEPTSPFHAATKAYVDGHSGGSGGGIPEAPFTGATYGRRNNDWELVINVSGGEMLGTLLLPSTPPTQSNEATNKQYVDNQVASAVATIDNKVAKSGDTMSGPLILPGNPTIATHAAPKGYVDTQDSALQAQVTANNTALAGKVNKAGDTMTGPLTLPADPGQPLQAAPKQYVDAVAGQVAARVAKAGDSMSGFLTLNAAPTADLHAATKKYVDDNAGGIDEAPIDGQVYGRQNAAWVVAAGGGGSGYLPTAGGTMTGFITLHANPTAAFHAATKQYADQKVARAGDTMTGALSLISGAPTLPEHAAHKNYVDSKANAEATAAVAGRVAKIGDTMTGPLVMSGGTATITLPGNPSNDLHAAPKQYVNSSVAAKADQSYVDTGFGNLSATITAQRDGYIYGLTLSNNATDVVNDIDIAVGKAASTEAVAVLIQLNSPTTKRLDAAWGAGTNQGGLDTGTIANTTYHVWLIMRDDTAAADVLFSLSATNPTMPAAYTRKRRIGSLVRVAGAIKRFTQMGDDVLWMAPQTDLNLTGASGNIAVLRLLTVPTGIRVVARVAVMLNAGSANNRLYVTCPAQDDSPATFNNAYTVAADLGNQSAAECYVRTDLSGQIRTRAEFGDASTIIVLNTQGYTDTRGRLGP